MAPPIPMITLAVLIACASHIRAYDAAWSYHGDTGPEHWATISPDYCTGTKQSPINIVDAEYDSSLGEFTFEDWDVAPPGVATWLFENNGHSAKIEMVQVGDGSNNDGSNIRTSGGSLPAEYTIGQFHFHWGSDDYTGSEHVVDGGDYPMELHFVHYKSEYGDFDTSKADGIAVIGVFLEISDDDNPAMEPLVSKLSAITNDDTNTTVTPFALMDLMPADRASYYHYTGSFTTPGCNEDINWIVMKDPIPISSAQMATFRSLKFPDGTAMVNNNRPLQPLNGRTITASFSGASTVYGISLAGLLAIALLSSRL